MSERDLELKIRTARWFWALGAAPVVRVRLTAYAGASGSRGKSRSSALTDLADLDVLGVEVAADFSLRYRAAECKSAKAGAKELFWLRGVVDYFGGGDGYLVAQFDDLRTPALRELAGRLRLGILTFNDFVALEEGYPPDEAAPVIFSRESIARADELLNQPSKKLERLTDYTLRSCWQLPQHRNLQQAIGYLKGAADALDGRQREHVLLFGEVVFRYLLALFSLCAAVLRRGYPHTRSLALSFLHGGELGLVEAQQRVRAVQTFQQQLEGGERIELADAFSEAPPYFDALLDVADRLLRRPALGTACLRQLTVALRGCLVADRSTCELMPDADPVAAKLVNDVASFLTRTAGLDRQLRERLADALEVEPASSAQARSGTAVDERGEGKANPKDGGASPHRDHATKDREGLQRHEPSMSAEQVESSRQRSPRIDIGAADDAKGDATASQQTDSERRPDDGVSAGKTDVEAAPRVPAPSAPGWTLGRNLREDQRTASDDPDGYGQLRIGEEKHDYPG